MIGAQESSLLFLSLFLLTPELDTWTPTKRKLDQFFS